MQNTLFSNRIKLARARTALFFSVLLALTLVLSFGFGTLIGEWWAILMLLLPSYHAARSIIEGFVLAGHKHQPLARIDIGSNELLNEKTAIVLHKVLDKSFDTDAFAAWLIKLSNSDSVANLKVVAVVDLCPENAESTGDDEFSVQSLSQTVSKLNEKEKDRYILIIRKRTFSEVQEEYICQNGRRGAILELARYMYSGESDFYAISGNAEWLIGARYVTLIDNDSLPQMNAASKLLSMAIHPQNKIRLENGNIISGHGIITPKRQTRLQSSLSSGFSKVFGLSPDRDDVFLSIFGLAEYSGCGIIDMYYYLQTGSMIPHEKHVLPEVIEGELLRCAYASDVVFYEDFPDTPQGYYKKEAVKVASSLQNLRFIFSRRLNGISKAKLFDSFITYSVPIAVFANMFFAFRLYSPSAEFAALLALSMYLFPSLFEAIRLTLLKSDYEQQFYSGLLPGSVWAIKYVAYSVVMLPTLAVKSATAFITASLKMISGKKLMSRGDTVHDPISFYILPEILSLALIASPGYAIRLLGVFFSLMPVLLALSEQEDRKLERRISFKDQKELSQYVADSWRFFEEFVTSADNGLPPESVEFSPIYRIVHQTSPESIGTYLLSCLAAYDQKLISIHSMSARIEETISSLERMEKLSGCCFERYDTVTLAPLSDKACCEGNGVLLASLVALKEGLDELSEIFDKADILSARIERLLRQADTSIFYDTKSMLMCKSVSLKDGQSDERHSLLMESSRLMSYYSIAVQSVPSIHWHRLGRFAQKNGFYCGFGSPNGSLDEFFLSEMFIRNPEGSSQFESLKYALWSQKKLAQKRGLPFGISECLVNSFDHELKYRSHLLGAPKAAILSDSYDGYAVSPYSVFLALQYDPHACMENLRRLKNAGGYSSYGFYESVDYTSDPPSAVKCLRSNHVGEMIVSGINALSDGIMQRRFMKNAKMSGAWALLEERFLPERDSSKLKKSGYSKPRERFFDVTPIHPRQKLLSNGSYTLCASDCGVNIALAHGRDIYKRTEDPIYGKRGFFAGLKLSNELIMLDSPEGLIAEFDDSGVRYIKQGSDFCAEMKVCLHESLCCELRRFKIISTSADDAEAELLIYLEPSLGTDDEMKLRIERDDKLRAVIVSRADSNACMAVGFTNKTQFLASFDKESVLAHSDSIIDAFKNSDNIPPSLISEPKPCVFIKTKLSVSQNTEQNLDMYIVYAESEEALRSKITELSDSVIKEYAPKSSAAQSLCGILLPHILFGKKPQNSDISKISGDILCDVPIISLILNGINDDEKTRCCLSAYKELREAGLSVQLTVLFDDMGKPQREHYNKLLEAAQNENAQQYIYARGGIIPIDENLHSEDVKTPILWASCYIFSDDVVNDIPKREPFGMIEILDCQPQDVKVDEELSFGGFKGNDYIVTSRPEVEWHHVLSNPIFGVIAKSSSLGVNSFGDLGERLILELDGKFYDIIKGAAVCFSFGSVKYLAQSESFKSEVTLEVSRKGVCKRLSVKITSQKSCRLAYVCDVGDGGRFIRREENSVILGLDDGFLAIGSSKISDPVLDKNAFFTGDWESERNDGGFCALVCKLSGAESVSFYLSKAKNNRAAAKLSVTFSEQNISLFGDRRTKWLKYQLLHANVYPVDEGGKMRFSSLLQNVCALASFDHRRSKAEILRCCRHQLSEGGVQKAWIKGKRDKNDLDLSAEELFWLPYAVCEYVRVTDDTRILSLSCQYFEEDSQKESVYEHCRRALDFCVSKAGKHGLVLDSERNEAVALSEMIMITLKKFCEIAKLKGDNMYAATLLYNSKIIAEAIKRSCKDSAWYIGGYTEFGEVFGASKCESGNMFLLPQALAMLAEVDEEFDKAALLCAYDRLHDKKRGLTKAFAPPYKNDDTLTGRLKYLPSGIAENGSQITSASVLFAMALEKAGFLSEAENVMRNLYPDECAKTATYKAEPYYACKEVYTNKNCYGRGADSLFSVASGWLLRQQSDKPRDTRSDSFDKS